MWGEYSNDVKKMSFLPFFEVMQYYFRKRSALWSASTAAFCRNSSTFLTHKFPVLMIEALSKSVVWPFYHTSQLQIFCFSFTGWFKDVWKALNSYLRYINMLAVYVAVFFSNDCPHVMLVNWVFFQCHRNTSIGGGK